jgi:hypothetical protein
LRAKGFRVMQLQELIRDAVRLHLCDFSLRAMIPASAATSRSLGCHGLTWHFFDLLVAADWREFQVHCSELRLEHCAGAPKVLNGFISPGNCAHSTFPGNFDGLSVSSATAVVLLAASRYRMSSASWAHMACWGVGSRPSCRRARATTFPPEIALFRWCGGRSPIWRAGLWARSTVSVVITRLPIVMTTRRIQAPTVRKYGCSESSQAGQDNPSFHFRLLWAQCVRRIGHRVPQMVERSARQRGTLRNPLAGDKTFSAGLSPLTA